MRDKDLFTSTTTSGHFGSDHGTTATGGHHEEGNTHNPETTHEGENDTHRHQDTQTTGEERTNIMKNRTAPFFTAFALFLVFSPGSQIFASTTKYNGADLGKFSRGGGVTGIGGNLGFGLRGGTSDGGSYTFGVDGEGSMGGFFRTGGGISTGFNSGTGSIVDGQGEGATPDVVGVDPASGGTNGIDFFTGGQGSDRIGGNGGSTDVGIAGRGGDSGGFGGGTSGDTGFFFGGSGDGGDFIEPTF